MLQPGQILQRRYTVRNHLGGGGMGSVYRAFDNRLSLDVAVKALTPQPGLNPDEARQLYEQFRREATVLAPGRAFQQLAKSNLEGRCLASYGVTERSLLLRTDTHLYRLGNKKPEGRRQK